MPKLSDERRKQWDEHNQRTKEFWNKVEDKYHAKQKQHAECRLCGDMITAIEPNNVFDELEKHEQSHPEYKEWGELTRNNTDFLHIHELLHDHDCVFVKCSCACGCKTNICIADLPKEQQQEPILCDICALYQGRGHEEHHLTG